MAGSPPPPYSEANAEAVNYGVVPPPTEQVQATPEPASSQYDNSKKFRLRLSTPSWWYPFKGIYYFATHKYLHPLLRARLLPCFILSLFVYLTLFLWAYLPQAAFLLIFHHFRASAWINAAFLVLGEGNIIIALLFEAFLVDETLADIFDAVLIAEGCESLVTVTRIVHDTHADGDSEVQGVILNPRQRLGKPLRGCNRVYSPFSLRQIVEFVLFLPFNFIPWIGTPLFLIMTGLRAGPLQHWRYFNDLKMDKKQRKHWERRMRLPYTWFGTAHLALQLVPGFSMLFLLTTAAGSALWVVSLEQTRTETMATVIRVTEPDQTHPEYLDDPV